MFEFSFGGFGEQKIFLSLPLYFIFSLSLVYFSFLSSREL